MDPVELSTGALRLRPWREDDVAAVVAAMQDPAAAPVVPLRRRRPARRARLGPPGRGPATGLDPAGDPWSAAR
ncbi:MAG TPA: hypothetical protein VES42_17655 [Pilimelia sp.]|nr:hypothetical protein [Pilimelia sp.]